jgi:hypothetical protein
MVVRVENETQLLKSYQLTPLCSRDNRQANSPVAHVILLQGKVPSIVWDGPSQNGGTYCHTVAELHR